MIAPAQKQLADLFTEPQLFNAWEEVAARKSAPGYDHVSIEDFSRHASPQLRSLRESLLNRSYRPDPLVSFFREKEHGGQRCLNIATVRDRIVCRVLADAFVQRHDRDLQPQCYSYRPHRGALKAVSAVQRACKDYRWAVRADIAEFFESLDHDLMEESLSSRGWSEPVVSLVRRLASAPRFDGVRLSTPATGIPMGLPLAPVISNLYLDSFDCALNESSLPFVRYADDIVVFARNDEEASAALAEIRLQLDALKLEPSMSKTRVYRCADGFLFLGFLFSPDGHVPSREAVQRLHEKLDEPMCTDETPVEFEKRRRAIRRGWRNYYGEAGDRTAEGVRPDDSRQRADDGLPEDRDREPEIGRLEGERPREPHTEESYPLEGERPREPLREEQPKGMPEEAAVNQAISDCTALMTEGNPSDAVYRLRRLLGDDETLIPDAQRQSCMNLLADAYEALGLLGAAQSCRRNPGDGGNLDFGGTPSVVDDLVHSARDVEHWLEIFGGEKEIVARQFVDRLGRQGYRPATHGLGAKDLQQHWDGKLTYAAPVYNAADQVRFGVVDLDITRAVNDRIKPLERAALLERMLDDARGLVDRARRAGVKGILEDSGCKGYHVWFLLHTALDAALVRQFLNELCRVAGPAPAGAHREIFPASDHCPPEAMGRYIKIPLGVHRLTGRRSRFLAPDGVPCSNGIELMAPAFRNRAQDLKSAMEHWRRYAGEATRQAGPREDVRKKGDTQTANGDSTAFSTLLGGCAVLRGLQEKAKREGHLTHAEHSVLRGVLGAMEDGGREAIHAVLKNCRNYSASVTDRCLVHPQTKPMGCTRIREILGEFCTEVGCDCRFRTRKNDYAHPLRLLEQGGRKEAAAAPEKQPLDRAEAIQETASAAPSHRVAVVDTPVIVPEAGTARAATGGDLSELLARLHSARAALLEAQAELLVATGGRGEADLSIGKLRRTGVDDAICRWVVDV